MIVYKYFMKIVLKNKGIILAYTMVFLLLSIVNGEVAEEPHTQFTQTRLEIAVVDNMNSELSRGLIGYLGENNNISLTKEDEEYIKEQIFLQILDGVIIIPADFDEKVKNQKEALVLYKDERKMGSNYLDQQIEKYLVFANAIGQNGEFDLDKLGLALKEKADIEIINGHLDQQNTNINNWFKTYYNFTSYIIIAIYVTIIGLVMRSFTDEKIENRIKVSSKKQLSFNAQIYLGQISLGAVITLVFILGSIVSKGKYIGEVDFSKYIINIMVFSFSIQCFAFLIGNFAKNRHVINGISTVVSLGVSFISGVMVPQELLSEKVLTIAKFFPSYYFVTINEKTINSLGDIRYEVLMQVMFGIVFLLLGLRTRHSTY